MTIKLFAHQQKCVNLLLENKRFGLWLEPGMGKTHTTLSAIDAHNKHFGQVTRTVVICPKSIMSSAWMKDAEHYRQTLDVRILAHHDWRKRNDAIQNGSWHVGIINFEQFKIAAPLLIEAGVRRFVVDESSRLKNHNSEISEKAAWFADRMDSVWLLSGTPAPNTPIEYYGQIRTMRPDICGKLYWKWVHSVATPITEKVWKKPKNGRPRQIDVIADWSQSDRQTMRPSR